jgi:hypothetical protein
MDELFILAYRYIMQSCGTQCSSTVLVSLLLQSLRNALLILKNGEHVEFQPNRYAQI